MSHRTAWLAGAGGRQIYWQSWVPAVATPRAAIVIAHGAGEHSDRYRQVAGKLTHEAYSVYALDHRGHGRSAGPRALIDRIDNAVSDLDQLVVLAGREHPRLPVFMLAHSMGATIALAYAIREQDRLAGLILSGALAALEAPPALRRAARLLSVLAPTLPLIAVDPALVSRDPAVVTAYRSDPLVHHGKLPARTLAELAAAIDSFPATVRAITVPVLILYGTADRLCPPSGSTMLYDQIGAADKRIQAYPGLFHEILNEPEGGQVLADICAWLEDHVSAAERDPAGAGTA